MYCRLLDARIVEKAASTLGPVRDIREREALEIGRR
jgi:hypothetical protein